MGMSARAERHWTARDVRALMDESRHWPRYELLSGELLVTPAPGSAHQIAVSELHVALHAYCMRERMGLALMSPSDIELVSDTIMQPDLFVVPNDVMPEHEDMQWPHVRSLLLAVEVISPSSARTDRLDKREFYLGAGVAEYWIVDLDARIIERWTPDRATPDVRRDAIAWHPRGATEPLVLNVAAFFDTNEALRRRL